AGFLLVVGPSGAGKSSLARAGLVTRLLRPGDIDGVDLLRYVVLRPGGAATPQQALSEALFRPEALPELAAGDYCDPELLAAARGGAAGPACMPILRALDRAAANLRAAKSSDRELDARLLLVLDQLEELFAADIGDAARTAFVRLVAKLVD